MYKTKVVVYCKCDTLHACEMKFINCVSGPYMHNGCSFEYPKHVFISSFFLMFTKVILDIYQ